MCAMQLDSIEGVNGKIQMNVTKGAVAKSKGTLVMLSLTKNVQRHDPSKLLRIIFLRNNATNATYMCLHKAFRNAVINFSGTKSVLFHFSYHFYSRSIFWNGTVLFEAFPSERNPSAFHFSEQ